MTRQRYEVIDRGHHEEQPYVYDHERGATVAGPFTDLRIAQKVCTLKNRRASRH